MFVLLTLIAVPVVAEEPDSTALPLWIQAQMAPKKVPAGVPADPSAARKRQSWAELIDETWGEGRSTGEKLLYFDTFWNTIDRDFACFQDLDVDWDALRNRYRPEVASGVSKGRFAAIMGRLSLALMEAHTAAVDRDVHWFTQAAPGVPLLVVGGWGQTNHFGACMTPVADGGLLVYSALENHPFGLEPGDLVLGYDGRTWAEIYPELLDEGLPISGFWGSSEEAYEHAWLMAAGANWHLFDALDIRRHATGEIEQRPTAGMIDWWSQVWCTEQVPVPGVEMPDVAQGELFSWGLIDGTRIGYIYGWGWAWDAEREFHDAIRALMEDHDTEGLIIDFRFNMGGDLFMSNLGLSLLFDSTVPTIDWVTRCDPGDHLALCDEGIFTSYLIPGEAGSYYDRPIAVLIGPGTVSSGDHVVLRMKFHPETRFFGKSTNTAFSGAALAFSDDEWRATFAFADAFVLFNPGEYLTHDPLTVDDPVWLIPDDVADGTDTVVEAAVDWIRSFEFAPRRASGRVSPP